MSVYFYCTAWALAKKPKDLDLITDKLLEQLVVDSTAKYKNEASAGKVISIKPLKIKIYAGESRGYAFSPLNLSEMYPDILFVTIYGADCTDEEYLSLIQNGKILIKYRGVIPYTKFNDHDFFKLLRCCATDKNISNKVKKAVYDLISKLASQDYKDAFRQDDHLDFNNAGEI